MNRIPQRRLQLVLTSALGVLATGLFGVNAHSEPAAAEAHRPATPIERAPHVTLRALALPWQEAELRAEASQTIAKILVREGQTVEQGQLLLEFDRRASSQQCQVAEAAEQGAKAGLRQAQLELRLAEYRHQQLSSAFAAGASTDGEMQEATVRRDQAEAAVAVAQSAIAEAAARRKLSEVQDQRRQLTAPFAGVIMRVDAELGELSDARQPLMVLADLSKLRVEWPMPIAQINQIRPRSTWQLSAGAPVQSQLTATLVSIEPRVNPVAQTVRVVFQVANPTGLPSGFAIHSAAPLNTTTGE